MPAPNIAAPERFKNALRVILPDFGLFFIVWPLPV
jgi:hypothetical protein